MRMLRRFKSIALKETVRSEKNKKGNWSDPYCRKKRERRMRWCEHVEKTNEVRATMEQTVTGTRRRGRPRRRWIACIRKDLRDLHVEPVDVVDSSFWRTKMADPCPSREGAVVPCPPTKIRCPQAQTVADKIMTSNR